MIKYPFLVTCAPEGGYIITFPDIPEAITQADTWDEVLEVAKDALETALSFYDDPV